MTENRVLQPDVVDWTDLGRQMWTFLTGRDAAVNYSFVDMTVEVPRDTGRTPLGDLEDRRTLRITTSDNETARLRERGN